MAFKVRMFAGAPDYETLHVAKLTSFPLEKRDYKPYSQARICFSRDGLHVQLLAFEAQPPAGSEIFAVLSFGGLPVTLGLGADGTVHSSVSEVSAHTFSGEDLQGIYWGGNLFLPQKAFSKLFPDFQIRAGEHFLGNFYKTCSGPEQPHYGSFFPADFSKPLEDAANLGDFVLIDY